MADIAKTNAQIATVYSDRCEVYNKKAAVDLTAGQAVTLDASGNLILADADDGAANTFWGIALQTVKAKMPCAVLYRGHVYGFNVSGLNAGAALYVSNTAGALADAAGAKSMIAGYIDTLSDGTKVIFIEGRKG